MNDFILKAQNIAADGISYSDVYKFGQEVTKVEMFLNVTAVTGTDPTLDVTPQFSIDGKVWRDGTAFDQKTGVASEWEEETSKVGVMMRFKFNVGSTLDPDFTFDIGALAKK